MVLILEISIKLPIPFRQLSHAHWPVNPQSGMLFMHGPARFITLQAQHSHSKIVNIGIQIQSIPLSSSINYNNAIINCSFFIADTSNGVLVHQACTDWPILGQVQ